MFNYLFEAYYDRWGLLGVGSINIDHLGPISSYLNTECTCFAIHFNYWLAFFKHHDSFINLCTLLQFYLTGKKLQLSGNNKTTVFYSLVEFFILPYPIDVRTQSSFYGYRFSKCNLNAYLPDNYAGIYASHWNMWPCIYLLIVKQFLNPKRYELNNIASQLATQTVWFGNF